MTNTFSSVDLVAFGLTHINSFNLNNIPKFYLMVSSAASGIGCLVTITFITLFSSLSTRTFRVSDDDLSLGPAAFTLNTVAAFEWILWIVFFFLLFPQEFQFSHSLWPRPHSRYLSYPLCGSHDPASCSASASWSSSCSSFKSWCTSSTARTSAWLRCVRRFGRA